ncbi:MAG: DUF4055 domain-containing protein [Ignisphaera sp.]|nr:DUF4055 domain-containing protein [Ignisphaera sp.]
MFEPKLHRQYLEYRARWQQLHTCLQGQEAVKSMGETYLPYPVATTDEDRTTEAFKNQYALYLEGAHFVEYTAEAVEDLVAAAFRRSLDITPDLPEGLDYLDLEDIAKELTSAVGSYGRTFFFVDYPTVETSPTMAEDGMNKAYVSIYEPLDVLNWIEEKRSGKSTLVYVLIREIDEMASAEMGLNVYMYRELVLENGIYKVKIHREGKPEVVHTPVALGEPFTEIPGMFLGTTSNTARVDKSPVIGISNSNLKHYQTWADLMHVQVYTGSPQLILTGLNPGWNKLAQASGNEVKIKLDAANVLALEGERSGAQLLQLNTDSLVHFRTLEHLETMMLEEGARIKSISKKAGVESAQALKIRSSSSMSKLASIVQNVEGGLNKMMSWVAQYMGTPYESLITMNTEFFSPEPDGVLLGAISTSESMGTAPRGTTITYLKQIELADDKISNEEYLKDMKLCNACNDTNVIRDASGNVVGTKPVEPASTPPAAPAAQ